MVRALPFLLVLVLEIYCLVDVISSRDDEIRNLPKVAWLLLVLFFPFVGSIAWLVAGKPQAVAPRYGLHERPAPQFPEYDRPGRAAATTPELDEEFLKQVRERAEKQRRELEEEQRKRREREA